MDPVPVHALPSVTFIVIGKLPVCVGVPLNIPAVDKVKPVGNVPVFIVKVDPPMEPDCVKV